MLVQERARRSNAGNRMQELLARGEFEADDMFLEAENDVEFEAREEEPDIVDSDFDGNSTEEESDEDVEAEESIAREEKRQRKAAKPVVRTLAQPKGPTAPAPARPRAPRTVPSVVPPGGVRSSSRRSTVENKMATQTKLQEAEARRASVRARPAKRVKHLTQDALIREALEMEEENTQSLLHYLEQEEERKARQRQAGKKHMSGPFVRWISVGLDQNIFTTIEVRDAKAKREPPSEERENASPQGAEAQAATGMAESTTPDHVPTKEAGPEPDSEAAEPRSEAPSESREAPSEAAEPHSEAPSESREAPNEVAEPHSEAPNEAAERQSDAPIESREAPNEVAEPRSEVPNESREAPNEVAEPHSEAPNPSREVLNEVTEPHSEAAQPPSLARSEPSQTAQEAHLPPAPSNAPMEVAASTDPDTPSSTEKTARTILSLHGLEPGATWVDEFRYLLGDHCAWDRLPFVPSRNRPYRPRQSTCVITGLPARYRDPRTGIPYATTEAYATIERVLRGEYVWTGSAQRSVALSAGMFAAAQDDGGAGGVFLRSQGVER